MNYLRGQKGYTLLLILVLIVLLFLITASFAVASMNQTKQIAKTDERFVSTSLAEMGTEYFSKQITNNIDLLFTNFVTTANTINNSTSKNLIQKQTDILQLNASYSTSINTFLASLNTSKVKLDNDSTYQLTELSVVNNKINMTVTGFKEDKETIISTVIEIPMQTFTISADPQAPTSPNDSAFEKVVTPPLFASLFPNPFPGFSGSTASCSTQGNDSKFVKDQICRTTNQNTINMINGGKYYYYGNNLDREVGQQNGGNTEIYIQNQTKQKIVFGNISGLSDAKLLINGPAEFKNYGGAGNLYTHINGDATFGHLSTNKDLTLHVEGFMKLQNINKNNQGNTGYIISAKSAEWDAVNGLDDSTISIEEDLKANQVTNLESNSTLIVGKNATLFNLKLSGNSRLVAESISINQMSDLNNSKICATKSISFTSGVNLNNNSKIFVLQDTVVSSNIAGRVLRVTKQSFQTNCGVTINSSNSDTKTVLSRNQTTITSSRIDQLIYK